MNWEKSRGTIVFTRRDGQLLFVIVQEAAGAYSFPKGHAEGDETEIETARREIWEETGLRPAILPVYRPMDEYGLAENPGARKQVVYFLAEFGDDPLVPHPGEIQRIQLLSYDQAIRCDPLC